MRRVGRLAAIAAVTWSALVAIAWWSQEALIFPVPDHTAAQLDATAARRGLDVHHPVTEDGVRLYLWHRPAGGDRAVIFFHGNGGGIGAVPWLAEQLPGWDIIGFSYRGYPGSEGAPSEVGMVRDARAIWRHVTDELGIAPDRIVVHGQSLGGGVSAHLLAEVQPAGVVWDSTFHSIEEIAATRLWFTPARLLLRHPFRTFERAPRVRAPVLLLHGDADTVIPVAHARRNAALLPRVEYHELPGLGHGHWLLDHPEAHDAWRAFLERVVPPR